MRGARQPHAALRQVVRPYIWLRENVAHNERSGETMTLPGMSAGNMSGPPSRFNPADKHPQDRPASKPSLVKKLVAKLRKRDK